jgi:hypothetical protein
MKKETDEEKRIEIFERIRKLKIGENSNDWRN